MLYISLLMVLIKKSNTLNITSQEVVKHAESEFHTFEVLIFKCNVIL